MTYLRFLVCFCVIFICLLLWFKPPVSVENRILAIFSVVCMAASSYMVGRIDEQEGR